MNSDKYRVDNRVFRNEVDYRKALHDKELIESLHIQYNLKNTSEAQKLLHDLDRGAYRFYSVLEQDFREELQNIIESSPKSALALPHKERKKGEAQTSQLSEDELDRYVQRELKKHDKRRHMSMLICLIVALFCFTYFIGYSFYQYRTGRDNASLAELLTRQREDSAKSDIKRPSFTLDEQSTVEREVLDEYKILLNHNKRLIGWVKIDDTNINYPVMQTTDNEYYLDHNLNQEYDKNGSIFMDKDCDVINESTNYIIYGHHMKNGSMFGQLSRYEDYSYYAKHKEILFDTIYEKGVYDIMFVFRSKVYNEEDIVFKYYQFIDADSSMEFDSYMNDMKKMSYYDTGVTAEYGDHLLTLSTCDYQEKNGRFVVVAKKREQTEERQD